MRRYELRVGKPRRSFLIRASDWGTEAGRTEWHIVFHGGEAAQDAGGSAGRVDADDVDAIAACIERADRLLEEEWARANASETPSPFAETRLLLGFSNGGAMAYRDGGGGRRPARKV